MEITTREVEQTLIIDLFGPPPTAEEWSKTGKALMEILVDQSGPFVIHYHESSDRDLLFSDVRGILGSAYREAYRLRISQAQRLELVQDQGLGWIPVVTTDDFILSGGLGKTNEPWRFYATEEEAIRAAHKKPSNVGFYSFVGSCIVAVALLAVALLIVLLNVLTSR